MNERETGDTCRNCGHREGQHREVYSGHIGCCAACIQFSALVCTTFRPAHCPHKNVHSVELAGALKFYGRAELPAKTQVDLCEKCNAMRAVVHVGTRRLESRWVGP